MGRSERAKGSRLERLIALFFRSLGLDSERQIQQRRKTDVGDVHVVLRPACVLPQTIVILECKNYKKPTLSLALKAIDQCEQYRSTDADVTAGVIHIPNTSKDYVFLEKREFAKLVGAPVAPELDACAQNRRGAGQ